MRRALLAMFAGSACLFAQGQSGSTPAASADHASAYYHYTLAHMYAELASAYGNRGDYVSKAIDNYKEAIKADPNSPVLSEELSDLYVQSGRLRDAQTDAEETLKQNPNDLNAHRLLARIFTRLIGDGQQNRVDENMLRRAVEQYEIITKLSPRDIDGWLMLARLQKVADNSVEAQKAYEQALMIDPVNEDALTGLALVYSDLGDSAKAAELLKTLAEKSPTARSLQALAAAYEQMHQYDMAAQALRKALTMNPPNERDLKHALAEDLRLTRKYDEALGVYNELTADDPTDATSFLRMSQIYREQKNFAKAREAGDKAKAIEPNSIEVRYNEVSILEAEDKTTEATQLLKDILATTAKRNYNQAERSSRIALLDQLARLYRSIGQSEFAVDAYRQMTELDSSLAPRTSAEIIEVYQGNKEFAKAQQEADAAIKKFPEDRTVRIVRDELMAEMGKSEEGAADLKKMLNGQGDRDIYMALADVYEKGKRWTDMSKALEEAEKLSSSDEEKQAVWFSRGAMFERMKKVDQAEAEFRKILKVDPENAGALNYIGYMLADRNIRLQESLDLITKALDRDPGNGAYLDSLGWVYFRLGRLEEAEKNLRRALDKTPRDPTVHDHMAEVLAKESKLREAVTQWEASLKEWDSSSPAEMSPEEIAQVKSKLEGAKVRLAREGAVRPKN